MRDDEVRLAGLIESFGTRPRPVRIARKGASWHQRVIAKLLRIVTLGGQRRYLSHYVTTFGHTIYVPDDFDTWRAAYRCEVLRHEAVHVRQFERFGWIGMVLIYGIFPLPLFFAYGRARLEWEAYEETLRAVAEIEGLDAARRPALHDEIVSRFTGPDYGWMWPFPTTIRRWLARTLDAIERQERTGGEPPE